MKSIERMFDKIQEANPDWSSFVCFAKAVEGKKFTQKAVQTQFNKLVDKDDYAHSEKRSLVRWVASKCPLTRTARG